MNWATFRHGWDREHTVDYSQLDAPEIGERTRWVNRYTGEVRHVAWDNWTYQDFNKYI